MSKKEDRLYAMRHSLAHITAAAVKELWHGAKFGVGPVVDNGFYYDIDLGGQTLSEEDFSNIEAKMRQIIKADESFDRFTMPIDKAIEWAKKEKQPYKLELLHDLKRAGTTIAKDLDANELGIEAGSESKVSEVSFYKNGSFTDLCRGPHVESTGRVGAFKLMRVAGAYWRGKEGNTQMQRLYGVAFETQKELSSYLEMIEEAKRRDHRLLGKQLDLFTFSDLIGAGLPLFTPRGTVLREKLAGFSNQLREEIGFQRVFIPHIGKQSLYEKSGHWAKFGDELFLVKSQETSDQFALKPMNCPHHAQIFASRLRSYRDLPLKYLETTTIYRDEKSGELHGLSRVRSVTQDDSHSFCRPDQIAEVIHDLISIVNKKLYKALDMQIKFRLSFRDKGDGYLGSQELWDMAQNTIEDIAKKNKLDFIKEEGEAAFYGPKIDFMAVDAMNRTWQVATIQLDFVQPERFELSYIDETGNEARPIMVHCALLGSIERFLSVYIEHTAGWFPFWLAPEQVRILTINDSVMPFVDEVSSLLGEVVLMKPLKYNELRFTVDNRNESLGRKIRGAVELKVPVLMIIGPKDVESREVSLRIRDKEQKVKLSELQDFLKKI